LSARRVFIALAFVASACGGDDRTLDPGAVGDDVVMKVAGTVVAASDLSPLEDVSVWVDVETA